MIHLEVLEKQGQTKPRLLEGRNNKDQSRSRWEAKKRKKRKRKRKKVEWINETNCWFFENVKKKSINS
jgi:hypothetical protein